MALATQRKRKSLLRTELEWLSRGARARSTKQKAHIDRIKAMQEMKDIQEERRVAMDSVASRMGNKTIEVSGLCKSYGDKKLIDNYEYIFLKNDRIGIIGHEWLWKVHTFEDDLWKCGTGCRHDRNWSDDPHGVFLAGK